MDIYIFNIYTHNRVASLKQQTQSITNNSGGVWLPPQPSAQNRVKIVNINVNCHIARVSEVLVEPSCYY